MSPFHDATAKLNKTQDAENKQLANYGQFLLNNFATHTTVRIAVLVNNYMEKVRLTGTSKQPQKKTGMKYTLKKKMASELESQRELKNTKLTAEEGLGNTHENTLKNSTEKTAQERGLQKNITSTEETEKKLFIYLIQTRKMQLKPCTLPDSTKEEEDIFHYSKWRNIMTKTTMQKTYHKTQISLLLYT